MTNLHDARLEAAVDAAWVKSMRFRGVGGQTEFAPPWEFQEVVRTALAAADAVVTVDGLQERIEDTLAYYQCRETNPKADHPYMGYHAFSEEQREWLRSKKSEAAAEIVRIIESFRRTDRSIIARQGRYIEGLENVDRSPDAVVTVETIAEVIGKSRTTSTRGDDGYKSVVMESNETIARAVLALIRGETETSE